MFKLTERDIEIIENVLEIYPIHEEMLSLFERVKIIFVTKVNRWYYVYLLTENEVQLYLKSTVLNVIQIKTVRYFSNCPVCVGIELLEEVYNAN